MEWELLGRPGQTPVRLSLEAFRAAARLHDLGKADKRFQALLLGGDLIDAWAQTRLWAKSAQMSMSPAQRFAAHRRSSLPTGFRHEMLSVQLAESIAGLLPTDPVLRDLALHLISSHHGYGRPFAPVVIDDNPPDVSLSDPEISLISNQRKQTPAYRLDSGIAERFWILTRHFGWWGLPYLEAILRLSDQRGQVRPMRSDGSRTGNCAKCLYPHADNDAGHRSHPAACNATETVARLARLAMGWLLQTTN
jgi:CRISPR-associated endonuclease/helicase Cas3